MVKKILRIFTIIVAIIFIIFYSICFAMVIWEIPKSYNNTPRENSNITAVTDFDTDFDTAEYPSLEVDEETYACGNMSISVWVQGLKEETIIHLYRNEAIILTDFLKYTEYNEEICRCMPEYTVETMFGTYGLSLSCPYVRYGDYQKGLTGAQVSDIKKILSKGLK